MLVLSRRVGEEIVIDGQIRIRLVAVGRGRARLGIVAPLTVRIDREEIANRRADGPPPAAGPESTTDRARLLG